MVSRTIAETLEEALGQDLISLGHLSYFATKFSE